MKLLRIAILLLPILCVSYGSAQTDRSPKQAPQLVKASFPGGEEAFLKYIAEHLEYPKEAQDSNVSGRVYLQFMIDTFGNVQNIEIIKMSLMQEVYVPKRRGRGSSKMVVIDADANDYCLGTCAVNVLTNCPKWSPATMDNKKVKIRYQIPINYTMY